MSSGSSRNDKCKEEGELAKLIERIPWLKHDDALEILSRNGGNAEQALKCMTESAADCLKPPQAPLSMEDVAKPSSGKKKAESYFVGGGPSSGQMMLADDDKKGAGDSRDVNDVINSIFEQVRREPHEESAESLNAFFGRGRRLGHTTTPSPFIAPLVHQQRVVVVTIYRDSYRIDDGPKFPKDNAEGVEFFESLKSCLVPRRIAEMHPNTNITVRLVDCMQHDAPPMLSTFAGEGRRLVERTPTETKAATHTAPSSTEGPPAQGSVFQLYEGEMTVQLAIVDFLGERKVITVNPKRHTVKDLFELAAQIVHTGSLAFELIVRDRPPRKLTDLSQTVDDANLRNSTLIMQRVHE